MPKQADLLPLDAIPEGLRKAAVGAAVALGCFAFACGQEVPQEEVTVRPVKLLVFGSGGSGSTREFPGQVSAAQTAELSFDVPGTIVEIPVREGLRVEKGALLARIDARDYSARADSERARMTQTGADLKRFEQLYKEKVVPRAQLDLKRQEYAVAEAAYREAEKGLNDTRLTAPFAGVVARKLVDERENVQAKQPVLTLQGGEGGLQIEVNFPEALTALMKPGLTLEERNARAQTRVVLTSLPDQSFPSRLTEFSTTADPVTRTFKATLAFEVPPDLNVLPGMTARVIVEIPEDSASRGANRVPANAVLADENGAAYVWRADPGAMTVHRAPVRVGALSGSEIEILEGLQGGDLIAISGMTSLREGMLVSRLEN